MSMTRGGSGRPTGEGLGTRLVEEAVRLVEEGGPDALSMRSLGVRAGVSRQAPYLHFPGGSPQLLAAIAVVGFGRLAAEIEETVGRPGRPRLLEQGIRYVRFGVLNPGLYRAMYSPLIPVGEQRALSRAEGGAGEETFLQLGKVKGRAFSAFVDAAFDLGTGSPSGDADAAWHAKAVTSMAHGLVGELIDEKLASGDGLEGWTEPRAGMTEQVFQVLFRGIIGRRATSGKPRS
jgi:AcrR family transcriptional regulator